ncbi:hypothetical protein ACS0TY_004253 [Phlomoides rotata]
MLDNPEVIDSLDTSPEWTTWRDMVANNMFNEWAIDPKVVSMRHKSWPYYESWLDIFGKDRATEEHVADPIDIVNELMMTEIEEEGEAGMKMDVESKETGISSRLVTNWCGTQKRLEFFLTLPDDEQGKYVQMLLDGKLGPLA